MNYVIWMDSEKAHIFALNTTGIEKSNLKRSGADHSSRDKADHSKDAHLEHFYRDLAVKLENTEQMLLMGPGLGKTHFKTYLESHHAGGLAKKVIGVENSDHPTDNQILASARSFFNTYEHFNTPVQSVQ